MARLAFKKSYVEPVLSGRKTQTMRRHTSLKEGDIVDATCEWGKPPFARLRVLGVYDARLDELTESDALQDGYDSLSDLLAALAKFYPGAARVAVISFRPE